GGGRWGCSGVALRCRLAAASVLRFRGAKPAVLTPARRASDDAPPAMLPDSSKADIAREFQAAVVDVLVRKATDALRATGRERLVVAGGVGANCELRARLAHAAERDGWGVFFPPADLCTDNGAMIALAGALRLSERGAAEIAFSVKPRWPLGQ